MDRRRFLQAASFGALALAVRRAFGDAAMPNIADKKKQRSVVADDPPDTLDLAAHVAKARARGVPLLVIVVPSDDTKVDVGEAWGELIHHGGDRTLPLGRADVVCASRAHAAELGVELAADTLAVTVDTAGRARAFSGVLPAYPPSGIRVAQSGEEKKVPTEEEVGKQRLTVMGKLVADALGAVPVSEARQLRAVVKAKLLDRPPPGSHWGNASGCGPTRVEETPEEKAARERREAEARKNGFIMSRSIIGYGCGMGHVPAQARRFLYFFTRKDSDSDDS